MTARYFLIAAVFTLLTNAACVLPPPAVGSRVVPEGELWVISALQKGRDLALSGQLDKAELKFRSVLARGGTFDTVYNNLGYVLLVEGRIDEAELMFKQALERAPGNISARANYARLLFQRGEMTKAIEQYQLVIHRYLALNPEELRQSIKDGFDDQELVGAFRSISAISFTVGDLDTAVCYSLMAVRRDTSDFSIAQHTRLLMSLNAVDAAVTFLDDLVATRGVSLSPGLRVDQATVLLAKGDFTRAEQSIALAVGASGIEGSERMRAALLNFLAALGQQKRTEARLLMDTLIADYPDLCESYFLSSVDFWPDAVFKDAERVLGKLCTHEEKQSIFPFGFSIEKLDISEFWK
jgi:tetratricopeptide (TPR) repeat protein